MDLDQLNSWFKQSTNYLHCMNLKDLMPNDAERINGKPVFTGTQVAIETLFDHIQAGNTLEEFLQDFPAVTKAQAMAVLKIAQNKIEM